MDEKIKQVKKLYDTAVLQADAVMIQEQKCVQRFGYSFGYKSLQSLAMHTFVTSPVTNLQRASS